MDLPQECWELVLNNIHDDRHYESLSLVSTSFLFSSNHLRSTLTVSDQTVPYLPRLLRRFHNVKKIAFRDFHGDLDPVLLAVFHSDLHIESLDLSNRKYFPANGVREAGLSSNTRFLKELNCSMISSLRDCDLFAIADAFPLLEKLDISFSEEFDMLANGGFEMRSFTEDRVTDAGVTALSTKLKALKKIDLSGNKFITGKSIRSLSMNCLVLREIAIRDCDLVTHRGISYALRNIQNLESISAKGIGFPSIESTRFKESFVFARRLCELNLSNSFVNDNVLCFIAEASLPLKKLVLSECLSYSFAGISFLLSKYRSLVYLSLQGANFLTDKSITELCKFFGKLTFINLNSCSKLTNLALFAIAKNCPFINQIKMEKTDIGSEEFTGETLVNRRLKSLYLADNNNLSDDCLSRLVSIFPCLEELELSHCWNITENSLRDVFKGCCNLRYLQISQCGGIENLEIYFELSKLEVFRARGIAINDNSLAMIGKSCPRLQILDIGCCLEVTTQGIKRVVENCKELREINLQLCHKLTDDIVTWMVVSRPSLRRIIPPYHYVLTESLKNFFLRHGCRICQKSSFSSEPSFAV